jgi:hypothetical protein
MEFERNNVRVVVDEYTQEEIVRMVVEYYLNSETYDEEALIQSDYCMLKAPELMCDIVELLNFEELLDN